MKCPLHGEHIGQECSYCISERQVKNAKEVVEKMGKPKVLNLTNVTITKVIKKPDPRYFLCIGIASVITLVGFTTYFYLSL